MYRSSLCLVLLLIAPALQAESGARVAIKQLAADRPTTLLDTAVRLDAWRLGGWFLHDPAGGTLQGYGQLSRGPWRVGGGALDRDAGVHLGFAPRSRWRWGPVSLRVGGDVAFGAGLLDEHDGDLAGRALPVDVLSFGLGARLELTVRPHRRVWVRGFAGGDGLAAAVSRSEAEVGLTKLLDLPLDGALSSALSEARFGGGARLSVVPWAGSGARLVLHAEERWDWIQLDPVAVWSSQDDDAPLPLGAAPWRSRREVGLSLEATQPLALRVQVSGRHTQNATALETFADRDGWSVAGQFDLRYRHVDLAVGGRYHLDDHPAEAWWGRRWPRHQLRASVGLQGALSDGVEGRLELGGQWTLSDAWAAPARGHVAYAQVTLWFGARPRRRVATPDPTRAWAAWPGDVSPTPTYVAGLEGEGGTQVADAGAPSPSATPDPADAPLPTLEGLERFVREFDRAELVELVDEYNAIRRGGIQPTEVRDALQQRPQLTQRIEEHFPGLLEFAAGFLPGAADDLGDGGQGGNGQLFLLGYGRQGVTLAPLRKRATAYANLTRSEGRVAADHAFTDRVDDRLSAPALAARWRLEKLTLWSPTGGEHELVLQARSSWSTRMRQLLRGF